MIFGTDTLQLDSLDKNRSDLTPERPKNKKSTDIKKAPKIQ